MNVAKAVSLLLAALLGLGCTGTSVSPSPRASSLATTRPAATPSPIPTLASSRPVETVQPTDASTPSPSPTSNVPMPVIATSAPDDSVGARRRVDRFWLSFDDVGCMGMVPPGSLEQVAEDSDLIVIGRARGVQEWEYSRYEVSSFLVSFELKDVLKGSPVSQLPNIIQILGPMPSGNVSDIDHLLFLTNLDSMAIETGNRRYPGDEYLYYANYGYVSIYANIDGRVVVPQYGAIKRTYGETIFAVALDGMRFDRLVARVAGEASDGADPNLRLALSQGVYFAC